VSGAGSPQQSGSPPTTSQRGSARRDFEGRERELMEEASSSDASSQPEAVASPRSSEIHTHTHTRANSPHSNTTSFLCTSSLPLSVLRTLPLLFHSLSPFAQDRIVTLAPSEQSRLLPGIATSTSNAARPPKPACVSASVSFASAPLVLSLLSVRVLD
jgi:hypothetical protein